MKRATALLSLLALVATACVTSPTGRRQLMLVSESQAIAASREAYVAQITEFDRSGKLVTDPAVLRRIDEITGRLIAQAITMRPDTADWEWSVEVVDEPETVNAWCMAGGRMAIYTGLIQKLDPTDDEIAQVMGHEIAHALANHTAERMSVAMATNLGVAAIGALSDRSETMSVAATAAALAIQLPNSRSSESEADRIGIELAAKAGYDPNAAVTLWQKMEQNAGGGPPAFLSTHPSPGQRQETLAALAPEMMQYYDPRGDHPVYRIRRAAR
ncbi:MAG TPA: M48 family metallopeptidase [Gammaproteobacteria bacterium]